MYFKSLFFTVFTLVFSAQAMSAPLEKRTICAWDPVGKSGPVISFFADLVPEAIKWNLDISFIPYEEEKLAAQHFQEGKCDIAIVTAIISRNLVQFAGTLDAIGGITSNSKLRTTMANITSPKATPLMSEGDFEVVAALPIGSMFAFVNDRKINSIDHFANKRIAVINGDIQTQMFAELAGATPVPESLSSFSGSFTARNFDIVLMPALAYETFELAKGLGKNGGILDSRLFYGMLQAVARKSAFDDKFGEKMRRYMFDRLGDALVMIENAEKSIPGHYWIKTPDTMKEELDEFYKDIRLALMIENQFDARALSLLYKIRCNISPNQEECIQPKAGKAKQ